MPTLTNGHMSQVHGNSSIEAMTYNCVRLLCSFGSPEQVESIPVAMGAADPLVIHLLKASDVHGVDGLGGVEGLLDRTAPTVIKKLSEALQLNAVVAMADALRSLGEGEKVTIVATGAFTNVAILLGTYPDLVKEKCEEIVCM